MPNKTEELNGLTVFRAQRTRLATKMRPTCATISEQLHTYLMPSERSSMHGHHLKIPNRAFWSKGRRRIMTNHQASGQLVFLRQIVLVSCHALMFALRSHHAKTKHIIIFPRSTSSIITTYDQTCIKQSK